MGAFFSIENDFIGNHSHCKQLDNNHIAYITKQYLTITKAKSIINDIQLGIKKNAFLETPELFLIHTEEVLSDLNSKPTEESMKIFQPVSRIIGVTPQGEPIVKLYTALDQYNDFFLHDLRILQSDSEKVAKAKVIYKNLDLAGTNALNVLLNYCNDIGRTLGELIDLNALPSTQEKTLIDQAVEFATSAPQKAQTIINQLTAINPDAAKTLSDKLNDIVEPK